MTSAYFFFWYVLPLIVGALGLAIAFYSRYLEKKTRPNRHPGE
ncbi:hypothetical protein SAMN03159496_03629 [Rhizobium sp. NFR07]|nr:hypothetical protein [Rhizobium sp. NFR07]SFB42815.1 hypothetical protein SAMN03159496_03629 [Rhizobium sp. NFR07]